MKVGDLICYNAAGMKSKTLGLVFEIQDGSLRSYANLEKAILIQWVLIGKYMPRRDYNKQSNGGLHRWGERIQSGQLVWHEFGSWFEVVR